jgi:hypothetical protein
VGRRGLAASWGSFFSEEAARGARAIRGAVRLFGGDDIIWGFLVVEIYVRHFFFILYPRLIIESNQVVCGAKEKKIVLEI